MRTRFVLASGLAVVSALAALIFRPSTAQGDAASDALAAAVKRGEVLWKQRWATGQKACIDCHASGPNAMKAPRIKSYPKHDKALNKVVTVQQKLNSMIVVNSRGTALELGSDDLNALEAYAATLR